MSGRAEENHFIEHLPRGLFYSGLLWSDFLLFQVNLDFLFLIGNSIFYFNDFNCSDSLILLPLDYDGMARPRPCIKCHFNFPPTPHHKYTTIIIITALYCNFIVSRNGSEPVLHSTYSSSVFVSLRAKCVLTPPPTTKEQQKKPLCVIHDDMTWSSKASCKVMASCELKFARQGLCSSPTGWVAVRDGKWQKC